jgi:hypothetical protein
LGLHADSSTRENARRERRLCVAGFQKRIWLSEKQLLNLRCHRITMVQATESRKGLNLLFTRRANFCRPTCWRVLRESEMRPVLVIVEQVGRHQPFEMPLIQDDHVVQQVASATSHPALRNTVCHGLRKAVRVGSAGIISEKAESSFAPSHSFCRCTFWRGRLYFIW